MAEKRDYYETLGISKSSSKDEIKSAYRKLAKKYHPDNKETGDEAKFKEVQEAYDILYDDQKRSTYDQFGHAAFEQGGGGGAGAGNPFSGFGFGDGGVDLGDIFSSFFGGGSTRSRGANTGPRKGNDSLIRIKVDFMDTITGRDVEIPIEVDEKCTRCNGTGAKDTNSIKTCPHCHGHGYVRVQRRSLFGVVEQQEVCPECGGTGRIVTDKCPDCNGQGYIHKRKNVKVHILAGINNGQQIRVTGMGERGSNGGENGDLYVEMVVKPHKYFVREGNDIKLDVPLDFVDAILGTSIEVPTVYGNVQVTIPAGTQPNTILRLKGQGVKDLRTGKPGDQYIKIIIQMPTSLSKEQRELLEKYKEKQKDSDNIFTKFIKFFKK
ncbi:MAG: molecular chaperone DnaJ, partial [Bacilli bacterium]|nr:molecular chaperone DnaJ [Bacilli bacterium]